MDIDSLDISSLTPEVLQMLAHMPAGAPPEGVVPNFENPPTRAAIQIWSTSVCLVLALLFFFNRLYIKARWMKKWSWDDLTLLLSVILGCGQYAALVVGVTKGVLGRHLWDISILQILTNRYMPPVSYAILVMCPWNLLVLKTTFFLLYLELFGRVRWVQITSWIGIGFVFLSNVIIAAWTMAKINPHEYQSWSSFATTISVPLAVLGLVADIIIFIIPFAAIIPLQMSHAKRMGALGIFLTGGSAIICSIFNIYYRVGLRTSTDNTWDGIMSSVFSTCEIMIAIVCACIPSAVYGFRQQGSIYQKLFKISTYVRSTSTPTKFMADSASTHSRSEIYSKIHPDDRKSIEILYPLEDVEMDSMDGRRNKSSEARVVETPEPAHLAEPKDVNMMV